MMYKIGKFQELECSSVLILWDKLLLQSLLAIIDKYGIPISQ